MTPLVLPSDLARADAVAAGCARQLSGHGRRTLVQRAQALADEAALGGEPDMYGGQGVVAEVEAQIRDLLGAEAAVMFPSGTLAQQAALRLHADDRGLPRVAMHPTSHPLLWEEDAVQVLHGLSVLASEQVPDDLTGLAAVLLELPRRETGGFLPTFEQVVDLSFRCAEAGVALHVDGARLWQCGPAFAPHSLADVVALADTTYLSLYKDLAGPAGAVLLCPEDRAAELRTWRHRHGGTLPALWPLALGARRGLRDLLPRMPLFVAAAQALAAVVETTEPVQVAMLHVVLDGEPQRLADALVDVSEQSGVWLSMGVRQGPRPLTAAVEVSAGEATLQVAPDEAAELLQRASALARQDRTG